MARIVFHPEGVRELLHGPEIRLILTAVGDDIAAQAQATASSAENGAGGTIDGYASAGFTAEYQMRSRRPRVIIRSNADAETFTRAHFHTQLRDGVAHLRAALYKFTKRG